MSSVSDLECLVQELLDRVEALTEAVDALTDEIQWRNNHLRDGTERVAPLVLTSMPLDPATDDWQINRVGRDGVPREPAASRPAAGSGKLFD